MRNTDLLIEGTISIEEALMVLDKTGKKILFVADGDRLVAALSDGDIRRYILQGGSILDKALNAANKSPKFLLESDMSKAEGLIRDEKISAIPIVTEGMLIKDIVCQYDTIDISNVIIRELLPSDKVLILEFFGQMAGDTRAMFNRGNINGIRVLNFLGKRPKDESHFIATVSEDNKEKIVGYVFLYETNKKIPWLGIAVHEQWKGYKLGRVLLSYIDDYAKRKGFGGIILTTVPANIRAQALYTNMGYEYVGTHPCAEFLYIKRYELEEEDINKVETVTKSYYTGA